MGSLSPSTCHAVLKVEGVFYQPILRPAAGSRKRKTTIFSVLSLVSSPPSKEKCGVVYTKPWVINLILDLVGYTCDERLFECQIVEPAAGEGAFLVPIIQRLAESCRRHGISLAECPSAIVAYEVEADSASIAHRVVCEVLRQQGLTNEEAQMLACAWIHHGNYLLDAPFMQGQAHYVVGNPPYIRLEDLEEGGVFYRSLYSTMVGRADIYVAFYEAALKHLKPDGVCGLICADRWMFNQYGAELRRLITASYGVEAVIQMHEVNAFDQDVSAYPAITIIRRSSQGPVVVASLDANQENLASDILVKALQNGSTQLQNVRKEGSKVTRKAPALARVEEWFRGDTPWPLLEPCRLALLRRLESEFPAIEETGAVVGIGVATGADKVFVTKNPTLVESSQLLPLAMAADAKGATVCWSGHYLVNPWNGKGLVNLDQHPKLAQYLDTHRAQLQQRHVARKTPTHWYRTIDRVNTRLRVTPKLYLPDFKGRIAPVLDRGETYPHHNLYFIISEVWDMEVLGGLLLSDVAQFFVEAYGVRMRGGYLRFQAQYLRRIRLPKWGSVAEEQAQRLRIAFEYRDVVAANAVAAELYLLSPEERVLLGS